MRALILKFCFLFFTLSLLAIVLFLTGCQTSPVIHAIFDSDDFASEAEQSVDSELTDWHYDTDDSRGAADEECYEKDADGHRTVWCDNPSIVAQVCDDFPSGCCCRQSCQPSSCEGRDGTSVPCSYFDLVESLGYCNLPGDMVPVDYSCNNQCTPRSQCDRYDETGVCLDQDASEEGLCLIYDNNQRPQLFCQQTCEMRFCDQSHMCVPLYDDSGEFSTKGACHPIQ